VIDKHHKLVVFLPEVVFSKTLSSVYLLSFVDHRVNEQVALIAMHTIWVREHNRLAKRLSSMNPNWSDEQVYQETRKIVEAQLQIITYKHWFPYIVGDEGMNMLGTYKGYRRNINPTISNVFATAAFR
jgi:peroxidase